MASNAFLNGFMGGMGAMNTMIDSKARREHQQWQKGLVMEDRALQAEQRAQQESLKQTAGILHWYDKAKPEDRKKMETDFYNRVRTDPNMAPFFDNMNPNETAEFSHLQPVHDKKGKLLGMQPVMNVYDSDASNKNRKQLRTGGLTDHRNKGGQGLYLPTTDLVDFIASPAMADTRLALETSYVMQGGTPDKTEKYGDITTQQGITGQFNLSSNKFNPLTTGTKSGSGSSSGSGGTWKNSKIIEKIDPTTNQPYSVQLQYQNNDDDSVNVRGMIHDNKGNTKIENYGVKHFDQNGNIIEYSGLDAMGLNPNPKPESGAVVDPNAPPVETDNPIPVVPVAEQAAKPQSGPKGHLSGFTDTPPDRMTPEQLKVIHDKFNLEGPSWANVKGVVGSLGNRIRAGFWDDLNRMGNSGVYAARNPGKIMDENAALMSIYQQFIDKNRREPTGDEFKTLLDQLEGAK